MSEARLQNDAPAFPIGPLEPAFVADCFYAPEGIMIDEILEIDPSKKLVRARMPTRADLPLTRSQRVHPVLHPRHLSGGLMVHLTGMIAYVHFYYVLGLRHSLGWTGYGVRIHDARFSKLAIIGEPLELTCLATKTRHMPDRVFVRYQFRFTQGSNEVYAGDQSAMWLRPDLTSPSL